MSGRFFLLNTFGTKVFIWSDGNGWMFTHVIFILQRFDLMNNF